MPTPPTPARTPQPPYWAVIFVNRRTEAGDEDYGVTAARMVELASTSPGFLGIDSVRGADGFGITVSYWRSEEDIAAWKRQAEHLEAQRRGHREWYAGFELRVAKVERAYGKRED
ncbi:antibiotic biosynthesis monooxygenase family protein [Rivibacter subsaxonicus]|uniref:Heme-degrading monooxygenase HmoA n=1 Tax=Rivibacter subsaxonicus TaxID=457575 RepID=A0A4Q7VWN6_9BURK|nr:antibiotic biosynthesis monooxygenase [Rivibacter subsaxonicus]RZU01154.1 heme-degrading monooxygenase HmoA [Rivibacter subsaxonicus]